MYHSFEDLEVWKKACALAVKVYEDTENPLPNLKPLRSQQPATSKPTTP